MLRRSVSLSGFSAAILFTWAASSLWVKLYHMYIGSDIVAVYCVAALILLYLIFRDRLTLLLFGGAAAAAAIGVLIYNQSHQGFLVSILEFVRWFYTECVDFFVYFGDIGYTRSYQGAVCFVICLAFAVPSLFFFGRMRGALILGTAGAALFFYVWVLGVGRYGAEICCMAAAILAVQAGSYVRRRARANGYSGLDDQTRTPGRSRRLSPEIRAGGDQVKLVLPAALVVVAFVYILTPARGAYHMRHAAFEAIVDDLFGVSTYLGSYSRHSRVFFDPSDFGYNKEFGGPITLNKDPIYEISNTTPILLRAAVKDVYTGFGWTKSDDYRELRFHSPITGAVRATAFAEGLPPREAEGVDSQLLDSYMRQFSTDIRYSVSLITYRRRADIVQSGRPYEITSDTIKDFYPYFDTRSETFSKRPLSQGASYTVFEKRLDFLNPGFTSLVLEYEEVIKGLKERGLGYDPYYEDVVARYTELPDVVNDQVRDFAIRNTEGIESPYLKMMILYSMISQQTTHSLDVPYAPDDMEFVEWFLSIQTGHCQHYATAIAVFARILGIPSRYIEGFSALGVTPEADGSMVLTGEQAHMWCEIYLEGIGWLPIDATIDYILLGNRVVDDLASEFAGVFAHTGTDLWDDMEWNELDTDLLDEEEEAEGGGISVSLGIIAALLLLLPAGLWIAIALYRRRFSLRWQASQFGPSEILLRYWRDMRRLIPFLGLTPQDGETSARLALRALALSGADGAVGADGAADAGGADGADSAGGEPDGKPVAFDTVLFAEAADMVERCVYGGETPEASALSRIQALHSSMDAALLKLVWPLKYVFYRYRWR